MGYPRHVWLTPDRDRVAVIAEVKEGITVDAVAPTLIETEMMKGQENLVSRIPLGRFGKADEVARAVMMLVEIPYIDRPDRSDERRHDVQLRIRQS
jgi:NAD(P)-dependent dehydrogenase (short-subunit alcohol dehydrogenase family)